jgi:hypothetical protein
VRRRAGPFWAAISFACLSLAGCGSGAPPYAACVDDLDCGAPSDACYRLLFTRSDGTEADGSLCSVACASDADCPEGGACVALGEDPTFFCASPCAVSSDCYAGFACTMVSGDRTMQLCLP